eukprot:3406280-Prorocentrum_lima.AAC.1
MVQGLRAAAQHHGRLGAQHPSGMRHFTVVFWNLNDVMDQGNVKGVEDPDNYLKVLQDLMTWVERIAVH